MQQPTFEIKKEESKQGYGRFSIEPLEQGYGHTLGSALRRVLLSSLPGVAVTQVKIAGLKHQFGTVKGVKEDGVDLLLNIKKLRISYDGDKSIKLTLDVKGRGEVHASQIKTPPGVAIVNKDLLVGTLSDSKSRLDVEMLVERGYGYSPAEERKTDTIGLIPLDATFSPVTRVNYKVEETRVGRLTNYDKLTLEIWTDGTKDPEDVIKEAAKDLITHLSQIVSPVKLEKKSKPSLSGLSRAGSLSVEELGLPTRISNALEKAGYEMVENLLKIKKSELSKIRNLGEKSAKIIEAALKEKGISWEE